MKGDDPNDELRFFATSRRGSKTKEEDWELEEPLESWIDSRPAVETGYDGDELHSYSRYRDWETDRKSTRLNSSHRSLSRMPSSA